MSSNAWLKTAVVSLTASLGTVAHAQMAPTIPLAVFGEVRTRSEWNGAAGPVTGDAFTYLRSRFGLRAEPVAGARVVLQGQDSRVLGAEQNTSPAAVAADVFELHQGYLELFNQSGALAAALRVGRQEIAFGNERLVGAANWTNVARSFDGARLILGPRVVAGSTANWSATLAAATVEERGAHFGAQPATATRDHFMTSLFASRTFHWDATLDGTVLYDRGGHYRAYDDATRTTVDSRLRSRLGTAPLRLDVEGAWQRGRQVVAATAASQDIDAWLASARLATLPAGRRHFTAGLGIDVLSGDEHPLDGQYSAFGTMYATNHPFYGLMDVIGDPATTTKDRGLSDVFASTSADLTTQASLRAEAHRFTMATGSDRALGWEADLGVPVRISHAATIELGYSVFRAATGATAVGLGERGQTKNWAYAQFGVAF